jgi:hypothetical protein
MNSMKKMPLFTVVMKVWISSFRKSIIGHRKFENFISSITGFINNVVNKFIINIFHKVSSSLEVK